MYRLTAPLFCVCVLACAPSVSQYQEADATAADAQPSGPDARQVVDAGPPADAYIPANVEVMMTGDNGYGFGWGTEDAMLNYSGGVESFLAGDIFNCSTGPESYTIPGNEASAGNVLYIIAWADKSTSQGIIGQFKRAGSDQVTYTGTGDWEVCATGNDFNPSSGGPNLTQINAALASCNSEIGNLTTTSGGWVGVNGGTNTSGRLQIGEDNTTTRTSVVPGNEFPIACNIDGEAKWMWYAWDDTMIWPTSGSSFIWPGGSSNVDKQFLIFRLSAEVIIE